jgi:hypothetical protein
MALVKKHLAYFTSRSFPLGSAPSALVFPHLGFRLTQISAHTDFGSHKGTLRWRFRGTASTREADIQNESSLTTPACDIPLSPIDR